MGVSLLSLGRAARPACPEMGGQVCGVIAKQPMGTAGRPKQNEDREPYSPMWRCLGETQDLFIEVTWGPAHPTKPSRVLARETDRRQKERRAVCVLCVTGERLLGNGVLPPSVIALGVTALRSPNFCDLGLES